MRDRHHKDTGGSPIKLQLLAVAPAVGAAICLPVIYWSLTNAANAGWI